MLPFTKMHSLGNDFVLLDGVRRPFHLGRDHIPVSYTHLTLPTLLLV